MKFSGSLASEPVLQAIMQNRVDLFRRPLKNRMCAYCGAALDSVRRTKEHVVGRNFVPRGPLNGSLNVILQSCLECNNRKSDLEDEISALTMYPDLARGFEGMGDAVKAEALRKLEKSRSRSTRKLIKESTQDHSISGNPFPGLKMSFTMTSPPQMDESRVHDLVLYHLRGFFFALTYNPETHVGYFWPDGTYMPIMVSRRTDWGNEVHLWFMNKVNSWYDRLIGHIADEHFRVAIRRAPDSELWSFAFEWNRSTRVIGFFGRKEPLITTRSEIPELKMAVLGSSTDGSVLRIREEIPLTDNADSLFVPAGTWGPSA